MPVLALESGPDIPNSALSPASSASSDSIRDVFTTNKPTEALAQGPSTSNVPTHVTHTGHELTQTFPQGSVATHDVYTDDRSTQTLSQDSSTSSLSMLKKPLVTVKASGTTAVISNFVTLISSVANNSALDLPPNPPSATQPKAHHLPSTGYVAIVLAIALSAIGAYWLWRVVIRRRLAMHFSKHSTSGGAKDDVQPYLEPKPELRGDGKFELSTDAEKPHPELEAKEVVEMYAGTVGNEIDGDEPTEMPVGLVGDKMNGYGLAEKARERVPNEGNQDDGVIGTFTEEVGARIRTRRKR